MKPVRTIFSIIMLSLISMTTFADTTNVVTDVVNNVTDVVNTVDTASLYKQVYGDFKTALVGIADALKVGVEHVYIVLVKQQLVKSIVGVLSIITFIVLIGFSIKPFTKWADNHNKGSDGASWAGLVLGYIAIGIIVLICIDLTEIVTGFVNPEYGAMKEIMEWVSKP
jgi:hypothetical protein